ncbi:Pentatricopeptide repeat-containing protein [Acorus calamus]|uniref:Pentatricopeptide repeat-containing protein n=1 Tax=Acorus calamus TaxID=4465 RepID=A0AAV9DXN6_ACOCL|nr:Pentatricopeptide repeat-containing protein [Acorus calamus]
MIRGSSVLHQSQQQLQTLKIPVLKQRPRELKILKCNNIDEFKQVHAQFIKLSLDRDTHHAGGLVYACAVSDWGDIRYARSIFSRIDCPDTYAFNAIIRGYVNYSDEPNEALVFYNQLMQDCDQGPDNFTFPMVLKGCARLSASKEGMQIHGQALKLDLGFDVYVMNSLINMMSFEGYKAEESALVNVVSSCAHLSLPDIGCSVHGSLLRNFSGLNQTIQTSLIDMYFKCGRSKDGLSIFTRMKDKDIFAYSAVISGLAMHGKGEKALKFFSDMLKEGLKPDEAIYVGVLSACSHSGLVDQGLKCFDAMMVPTSQHYGCVVDLMARAGKLEKAYEFIKRMPIEVDEIAWRTLLSACKVHNDLKLGEFVAKNLFRLGLKTAGDHVLMSSIYARARKWDNVAETRLDMASQGLSPIPGFSYVVVKRKTWMFFSQDRSHPDSDEVYEMLYQMGWQLRFEGYSPDTTEVFLDVGEAEKRRLLEGHSQKITLAFAMLKTERV